MTGEPKRGRRKGDAGYYRAVIVLATIPFTIAVAPILGWLGGRWLDRRAGTDWVFQAIGIAIGIGAAIRETVFLVRRVQRDLDAEK